MPAKTMMSAAALRTATTVAARAEPGAASWTRWSDRAAGWFPARHRRPLTHSSIAGVPGQLANLAGEVADRRIKILTLVSRCLGRISDHGQGAAADQVELAGVLVLLDDRVALRAPGGRAARDPLLAVLARPNCASWSRRSRRLSRPGWPGPGRFRRSPGSSDRTRRRRRSAREPRRVVAGAQARA